LVISFTAYAGGNAEKTAENTPAKKVEITFASQPTPSMDYLISMIPEFEKATGIKVKSDLMPYDNLVQKVTIDCTTNTKQYSCFWMEPTWLGRFENEFEPLEKYINDPVLGKDFNLNDFSKSFLDEVVRINGKMIVYPSRAA
jgi:ABC-type glycerol-3-phosphate transport system substrate-binding protein